MTAVFANPLLTWFDRVAADLPWRSRESVPDPYAVWLSEVMLQQTQVETVIPYFQRFLAAYPTVRALADAPLDDILKQWEGLGYYSRARNLYRAAQVVAYEHEGRFPEAAAALLKLPGIGRYTAGAIASIAFNQQAALVDGNVYRVFARLMDYAGDITTPAAQAQMWAWADEWIPPQRPGDYNQALMELGRTVCTPKSPDCGACPIREFCRAADAGTQAERPVKKKAGKKPHYQVTAGVIRGEDNRLLIAQRPMEGLLGGLWEFPGGKQAAGETLSDCLQRELMEELGIEVEVGDELCVVKHAFTHFSITLHALACVHSGGTPQALQARAWAWVTEAELDAYSFGKADREVIKWLRGQSHRLL